jgi:ribonucleoside-diphosphate reductase alpha chain
MTRNSGSTTDINALHDLGYKIFLDRYALKDMTRQTLAIDDTVIVVVNEKTGQREVGKVTALNLPQVSITLLDGSEVTRDIEHVDKPLETHPGQMMDRVARGIAEVETDPTRQAEWSEKFRWLLDGWKFVPGGRILTGAGTDQSLTYYNCFVLPSPKDSRGGIMETLSQMTEIMSRGGGVGINLSTLRPRHAYVKGVNGRSSGSVSWGALYSFVTGLIEQGGSRRGALMLILNDWHPDVFNFINSKRQAGQITNANISVGISDDLMAAVKADADWKLMFPDTSDEKYDETWDGDLEKWMAAGGKVHVYKTVKAREIWDAVIASAWASAEPGVWFRTRSNVMSNSWYFNPLISTNPCGEQPLPAFGICNLGALNLSKFYDGENEDVAWDDLRDAVRYAVRFLDNVIDSTPYFFEENARVQGSERRVGLGTMGVAELLIRLKIRYGSVESQTYIENLYKFIAVEAYTMSTEIAAEKGQFSAFDAEKFLQSGFMLQMPEDVRQMIRERGMRNVTLLTQAPTGTTGTLVNTSTGIEPFFSWVYYRKSRLGLHEEKVPIVQQWLDAHPDKTDKDLPEYFAAAMDLTPEEHVQVQGSFQKWIDSAISKTCNVPNDYTVEQVSELYKLMYELGCKGGTIYRDGSRDEQVLMLKGDERAEKENAALKADAKSADKPATAAQVAATAPMAAPVEKVTTPHRVYPRPAKLFGVTTKVVTPFGTAYVNMNVDELGSPFEVFITAPGKAGSDLQADAEGLGRLITLSLRTTDPHNRRQMLRLIIEQLRDIGGASKSGFGANRVNSLPDAVARVLEDHFFHEPTPMQLNLPLGDTGAVTRTPPPLKKVAEEPVEEKKSAYASADLCPSCQTVSLIRTEGCKKCLTCGYSEC